MFIYVNHANTIFNDWIKVPTFKEKNIKLDINFELQLFFLMVISCPLLLIVFVKPNFLRNIYDILRNSESYNRILDF